MKILLIILMTASCISQPRVVTKTSIKSVQEKIMDCFSYIKTLGANDKFAGEFCTKIYGDQ